MSPSIGFCSLDFAYIMTAVVQRQDARLWPSRRAFDSRSRSSGAVSATAAGWSPEPEVPVQLGLAPLRGSARGQLADDARPRRRKTKPPQLMLPWSNPAGCCIVSAAVRVQIAAGALDAWLNGESTSLLKR